jgi:hypothetical protein
MNRLPAGEGRRGSCRNTKEEERASVSSHALGEEGVAHIVHVFLLFASGASHLACTALSPSPVNVRGLSSPEKNTVLGVGVGPILMIIVQVLSPVSCAKWVPLVALPHVQWVRWLRIPARPA